MAERAQTIGIVCVLKHYSTSIPPPQSHSLNENRDISNKRLMMIGTQNITKRVYTERQPIIPTSAKWPIIKEKDISAPA